MVPKLRTHQIQNADKGSMVRDPARRIYAILLLALVVRLVWIALCPNQPVSDQGIYHHAANEIAQGKGFLDELGRPIGWWPVGYPALLGATYAVFGPHVWVGHLLNALLGVLTVAGVHALAKRMFGSGLATLAALLAALHPTLVLYTTVLATEHPFECGSLLVVLAMGRAFGVGSSPLWALGTGLLIGGLTYVRPTALALLPLALAFAWPQRKTVGPTLTRLVLLSVTAFAALVPWGIRNQQAFGVFSLTSLNAGSNLWMGNHEGSDGCYVPLPQWAVELPLVERESRLREEAVRYIRADPAGYAKRCVARSISTLRSDTIAVVWNEQGLTARIGAWAVAPLKALCTGVHALLYAAAALGMLVRLLRGRFGSSDFLLCAVLALLALPFVLIVGGNRYHLPLIPFVIVAALAAWRRDHSIS